MSGAASGAAPPGGPPNGDAPDALQRSERRLRALVETAIETLVLLDAEGRTLYANRTLFEDEPGSAEDLVGGDVFAQIHPDDLPRARSEFARLLAEPGLRVRTSHRVLRSSGRWAWLEGTACNLLHDPAINAIVVSCRDVTRQRETESAYRSLVDRSFQAQAIFQGGRLVFANQKLAEITGYALDELLSFDAAGLLRLVPEEERARIAKTIRDPLAALAQRSVSEVRHVRKDGAIVRLEVQGAEIEVNGAPAVQLSLLDVTEQRRAEEALRWSERHFRSLIEGAPDLVTIVDDGGTIVYASPSHERLLGWRPDELVGRAPAELLAPMDHGRASAAFGEATDALSRGVECRVRHKDGSWRVLEVVARRTPAGSPIGGFVVNAHDVTARRAAQKQTEALLEVARDLGSSLEVHELLERVGRHVAAALAADVVATFRWDEAAQRYRVMSQLGVPAQLVADAEEVAVPSGDALLASLRTGALHIADADAQPGPVGEICRRFGIRCVLAVPLSSAARHHGALVVGSYSAGRRFEDLQVELLAAIAGQLAVALERATLHREQRAAAELFGALARAGQELLLGFARPDLRQRVCRVFAEALACPRAHLLEWRPEEEAFAVVGGHGTDAESAEALRLVRIPAALVASGSPGDGGDDLAVAVAPGRGADPGLPSILGVPPATPFLSIVLRRGTEVAGMLVAVAPDRRAAFRELQRHVASGIGRLASLALDHARAVEQLDRANRLKSDFVAMISHELRTPLNVILGYTDLLLDGGVGSLAPAQVDVVRRIDDSGHDLFRLIGEVLDLSRLETGRIPLDVKRISGRDLVAEIEADVRSLERDRESEVELHVDVAEGVGEIATDTAKLKVALKNLIGNAFKFTERGRVSLRVRPEAEGVGFTVEDTGIGIPVEHLGIIFEPFRQVEGALVRRRGGVGLGLYIVRRIVDILGGAITVDSRPGEGSRFRVWIPTASRASAPVAADCTPGGGSAHRSDALTGFPTLELVRAQMVALGARGRDRFTGGVLALQMDGLGAAEAAHGRRHRDGLACMVAERLAGVLRAPETIAHGGDGWFLVLVPGRVDADDLRSIACRLLSTLSPACVVDGIAHRVEGNVGIASVRDGTVRDEADAEAIIARARAAVARGRSEGRAVVTWPAGAGT